MDPRTADDTGPRDGGEPTTAPGIESGVDVERRNVYGIDVTVVRYNNAEYYVPDYALHRPVSNRVLSERKVSRPLDQFVKRLLKRRPGSMVHAGAFFGDMLPSFSRKTPGTVYAFEPVIENYLLARAVVETNQLGNVLLMHAGLGASPAVARIGVGRGENAHKGGAASIITSRSKPHSVTQLTSLLTVDQFRIDDLALIQLDTEGYELPILQGAAGAIGSRSPVVVVEDNKQNCGGFLAGLDYVEVGRLKGDTVYAVSEQAEELAELVTSCRRGGGARPPVRV